MARTPNKDVLARYRKQVDQSKRWRKEDKYDKTWRRMVDMYRGKHYDKMSQEDRMLVNMSFSTINVIAPSVAVNHPKITVGARQPKDGDRAVITEAIINYWWRHFDCQAALRRAVDDYLIMGHGWVKVGYRFVEEEKVSNMDGSETFSDVADKNPDAPSMETEMVVLEDRPFVERVSPFNVYVNPEATNMQDLRWIAQRIKRPLTDVQNDKRYNRTARMDATPSSWSKWGDTEDRPRMEYNKHDAFVDVWEFYDISRNTMAVFCDGGDGFLINPRRIPYAFGHPFVMMRNYDVPENFYPIGELEAIEPLQLELNETRTQMMNHRKRFARKWLYKESAFDTDGRNALESDEDNVMVPVMGDENLGGVVVPMPAVINPPDMYNVSNMILGDIDRISGVGEFMRGGQSEISRTATEAAMMQDAMNARTSDKLAEIERTIAGCARRLIGLAQQFMTGDQVIRVVGSSAMPIWVTFDRDYITGEFDFEVEAGSTQPVNESFRRQMALQMVDAMAPFMGTGIIDPAALARHVLQFGFGVKTPEAFFAQQQPMQPGMEQGQPGMQSPQQMPDMGGGEMPMPMEGVPTGGMPLPSTIPPQVLSAIQNSGADLPNIQ
jgi:hypothetical protein